MTSRINRVSENFFIAKGRGEQRLHLCFFLLFLVLFYACSAFSACSQEGAGTKSSSVSKIGNDKFFSPGDDIPELELSTLFESGIVESAKLGDLVKTLNAPETRAVLLNFWASWCVPCVKELPDLELLHKNQMVKGLRVVSVNTDAPTQRAKVLALKNKYNLSFPIILDPELESVEKYRISGFPETFLIDRDGRFMLFNDPKSGESLLRILSDREWSSPEIAAALQSSINEGRQKEAGK